MKRANLGLIRDHFRLEFGLAFGMVFEWGGGGYKWERDRVCTYMYKIGTCCMCKLII